METNNNMGLCRATSGADCGPLETSGTFLSAIAGVTSVYAPLAVPFAFIGGVLEITSNSMKVSGQCGPSETESLAAQLSSAILQVSYEIAQVKDIVLSQVGAAL